MTFWAFLRASAFDFESNFAPSFLDVILPLGFHQFSGRLTNNKKLINPLIIRKLYLCPLINHLSYITMNKGIVKFFNESKGFGFIKDESTGKEYFVHVSGLTEKVKENDVVTFELIEGRKGLNAVNVRRA